jgi:hypothetical protein
MSVANSDLLMMSRVIFELLCVGLVELSSTLAPEISGKLAESRAAAAPQAFKH